MAGCAKSLLIAIAVGCAGAIVFNTEIFAPFLVGNTGLSKVALVGLAALFFLTGMVVLDDVLRWRANRNRAFAVSLEVVVLIGISCGGCICLLIWVVTEISRTGMQ